MTKPAIALPVNKRINEVLATFAANEGKASSANELYDDLVLRPVPGLTAEHAPAFAMAVYNMRRDAWLKANPFRNKADAPKERRADGTAIRNVLAFADTGALKQWKYLCGLTNAYGTRAACAGAAAKYFADKGVMPANKWFDAEVKRLVSQKTNNNRDTAKRPASVYLERIVEACGRMAEVHPRMCKDAIANILKAAKAAKIEALGNEAQAKVDAKAKKAKK